MGYEKKSFAGRLRRLRTASGLTGAGLAARTGVDRTAIVHMEKGDMSPSVAVLAALAEALGVTTDHLLGLDGAPPAAGPPLWLAELMPDLETLDSTGREAVRALVRGLKR
jgi:transcriptional regulator with XRE-family HTH domain